MEENVKDGHRTGLSQKGLSVHYANVHVMKELGGIILSRQKISIKL